VRPLAVVMGSELPKDSLEVTSAEDQHVVEALAASRLYPPLGERVRLRGLDRGLDDPDAFGPEDLVEGTAVLRVTIPDQKPNASKPLPHRQIPGLLGHPGRIRVPGDAEDVHPAGPELDAEQHVQRAEPGRLDGEEVERQDSIGLSPEKLAPRGTPPAWGRAQAVPTEHRSDGRGAHSDAELQQLAPDPEVAPPWVLPGQSDDELYGVPTEWWSARPPTAVGPLAPNQLPVPSEQGSGGSIAPSAGSGSLRRAASGPACGAAAGERSARAP